MIVELDTASPVPIFEQLRAQLERLIVSGTVPAGRKLPPIRALASNLDIAPGTVNKVYEALARDGLVESAGRHGTTVLAARRRNVDAGALQAAADALALVARQTGVPDAVAQQALDAALRRI